MGYKVVSLLSCLLALTAAIPATLPEEEQTEAAESRIVGGQHASLYSNPSIVSLQYKDSHFHFCGGILISEFHVLTAAHCLEGQDVSNLRVKLGALNIHDSNQATDYQKARNVAWFRNHPGYASNVLTGITNDIAVLRMDQPAKIGGNIQIADLDEFGESFANTKCRIAGWGMTSGTGSGASHLKEVEITKITNALCRDKWGFFRIRDEHICVFENGPSACMGDSGGPMYCGQGKTSQGLVAGVTSWGDRNCGTTYPSVYTRVSQFYKWIQDNMV